MFYCNECAVKYGYPESLGKSIGKCECCDSIAECNDTPSKYLFPHQKLVNVASVEALTWWKKMNLEEKFYKTIKHNALIDGDHTRHPSTLTDLEIETIYTADHLHK